MLRLSRMLLAALAVLALVVGVMPTAHADDSTATYIVELRDGLSAQAVIPGLLGNEATILTQAISGGIATLTTSQAKALESNPSVKSVRLDTPLATTAHRPSRTVAKVGTSSLQAGAPWDLDILDSSTSTLDGNYSPVNGGNGVSEYVIDTGIYRAHAQFAGLTIATGYDFVSGDADPADCDGQGTAVASLIGGSTLGVAKNVKLVPLRVLDCNGSGYASDLLSALNFVITDHAKSSGPAVVVVGLGADVLSDLDTAVQNVVNAGITVVVAADYQDVDACQSSPGRVPAAITVAASTSTNTEASGTSYGSCIDLYAPGQDVSVAGISATTAVATGSGTAYSAGIVAGIAAQLLYSNPTWSPAQVSAKLLSIAATGRISNARSANKLANLGSLGYEPFVKASYMDFLGRLPSDAELAAQVAALQSGATTSSAYLTSLSRSDEWLASIVTKMYADTLNRAPDPAGLQYWVGLLRSGTFTVAKVASLFYSSKEYFSVAAGGNTSTWVTLLYQKLLNRDADGSGLQFWIANTNTYGMDWVAYNFYQSQETRARRVQTIYETLLGREPDSVGWPFWTARVLTTGDLQLAWEVANSTEYWDRAHTRY